MKYRDSTSIVGCARRYGVLAWAFFLVVAALCSAPKCASADEGIQFFETHIRPVLVEHCYECHSMSAGKSQGELLLDSRDAMREGGSSGPAVVPGELDASLILDAIRYESFEMPPKGKLDAATIEKFEHWVRMGAPDPREKPTASEGMPSGLAKVDWEAAEEYWSFKPREQVVAPEIVSDRVRGPVDAFVWAKLQESNLQAVEETSRENWLRRVTFDLIGLPPTPEQLESFLKDDRPDAKERVVDRLLASPRYGERHGRHWLDLARYADSNGADENHGYPVAWRYRDYVIDAYNRDVPYDHFVIEQLAGDLLPATPDEERSRLLTATGFLVLGPKMLAEQDKPKLVADLVDEQLDTVGKVFLGLTLGCARCHDHKFDPIRAEDYYALAGIFHSTKSMKHLEFVSQWNERELPSAERVAQIAAHEQRISQAASELKQFELALFTPRLEQHLIALATWMKWRATKHEPTADEIQSLGGSEKQRELLRTFSSRSDWSTSAAKEVFGDEVRALLKELNESTEAERVQAMIIEAVRTAALDVFGGAKDDKGEVTDARLKKLKSQLYGKDGPLVELGKLEEIVSAEEKAQLTSKREHLSNLQKSKPVMDLAMAAEEGPVKLVSVHVRGNHLQLSGNPLPRSVPSILQSTTPAVAFPENQSGRLEFALWLTAPDHPLTARVMVNRLWQQHFGEGLVRSASNFGLRGDLPTHPELLDYLANEFVRRGWSQKAMHRDLVLSSTYALSSDSHDEGRLLDPDNRLLWRMHRKRLEVEPLRDALLVIADEMDWKTGGQAEAIYGSKFEDSQEPRAIHDAARRTIYLPINRAALEEFFATFDYVDSAVSLEKRPVTTVPHQALFLMNHRLSLHAGWRLAKRMEQHSSDTVERLKLAYAICFARAPTEQEIEAGKRFLLDVQTTNAEAVGSLKADFAAWVKLARSLIVTNEFLYID